MGLAQSRGLGRLGQEFKYFKLRAAWCIGDGMELGWRGESEVSVVVVVRVYRNLHRCSVETDRDRGKEDKGWVGGWRAKQS